MQVSLHGASAPKTIYDIASNPKNNFKNPGELTALGMRQHYLIGTELRHRYTSDQTLVKADYDIHEFYLQSTFDQRTIVSI